MSTTDPNEHVPESVPSAQPPGAPAGGEPDTISVSRADYEQMQENLSQARATFDVLNPHAARLEKLIKDPHAAELFDNALESYQQFEARRKPPVDENMRPIYEKVSKLEKYVDDYEATRKAELERPQREFTLKYNEWQNSATNNRFFQRLMADHPELKPRDVQYLAQVAAEANFEPLEAVWKKESWRFERAGTAAPPPSSLRADAGEVGSAPSAAGAGGPTMRDRIIELERARRGMTA